MLLSSCRVPYGISISNTNSNKTHTYSGSERHIFCLTIIHLHTHTYYKANVLRQCIVRIESSVTNTKRNHSVVYYMWYVWVVVYFQPMWLPFPSFYSIAISFWKHFGRDKDNAFGVFEWCMHRKYVKRGSMNMDACMVNVCALESEFDCWEWDKGRNDALHSKVVWDKLLVYYNFGLGTSFLVSTVYSISECNSLELCASYHLSLHQ